ncbi:MAG: hypothetical protein ACK562_05650, partial [Acidobacteriota bacterium]
MKSTKQFRVVETAESNGSPPTGESPNRLSLLLSSLILRQPVQNWVLSRRVQILIDGLICASSFIIAHLLRFDGWPPGMDNDRLLLLLPYLLVARIGVNYLMGLYRRVWRDISIQDSIHLAYSVGIV